MTDHLSPGEFYEFIDQGGGSGPGPASHELPGVSLRAGLSSAGGGTRYTRGGTRPNPVTGGEPQEPASALHLRVTGDG